jgi:hypothetical protein
MNKNYLKPHRNEKFFSAYDERYKSNNEMRTILSLITHTHENKLIFYDLFFCKQNSDYTTLIKFFFEVDGWPKRKETHSYSILRIKLTTKSSINL